MLCISCIFLLVLLIFGYLKHTFSYWKRRNVPHPVPHIIFGNLKNTILLSESLGQVYASIYTKFPNEPYVGFYKVRQPGIILRDPELIHSITIKHFNHFMDNDWRMDEKVDPLMAKDPFFHRGQRWKRTRSQVNGNFTPVKLKAMFPLIKKVSNDMITYIQNVIESRGSLIETKELISKYTIDNVTSCIMGLEGKSFEDEEAVFRKLSKMWTTPSVTLGIKVFVSMIFPSLIPIIKAKFIPKEAEDYFINLVHTILKYRKENNVIRNDVINNMNEIREKDESYTMDDLIGHVFSFFVEGSETSSLCLSFVLLELSSNTYIQEKARREIKDVLEKHDGDLTFEAINELTYLDCIICETLRLYPPAMNLLKLCTETYNLPSIGANQEPLKVDPETPVIVPIYSIQRDPKYFPEPEKFDPERFSEENKSQIVKGSYLPFGEGPRACIGQRFAMSQIKVGLVALLNNFDIRCNAKTKIPIEIDQNYFLLTSKGGIWLDYYTRSK